MRLRSLITLLCLALVIVAIIWRLTALIAPESPEQLIVFAASSMTNALDDASDQYRQMHPDLSITLNYAGSSTLSAQILEGAPADLFISADHFQMDQLVGAGLISAESVQVIAENELILIVPSDNTVIQSMQDLATSGISLVLANQGVPIRVYSDAVFASLASLYGADYPQAVYANVVSEEPNVRQVVARIAVGEADAGLVYRTDVTADILDRVRVIEIPVSLQQRPQYTIAILAESEHQQALANDFLAFLLSEQGQMILQKWGFLRPNETQ